MQKHHLSAVQTLLRDRFGLNGTTRRKFHDIDHSAGVVRRTVHLVRAMRLGDPNYASERLVELALWAGWYHDTVQDGEVKLQEIALPGGLKVLGKKLARFGGSGEGKNEYRSAQEAAKAMEEAGGYDKAEIDMVRAAILATAPGWDTRYCTVFQPALDMHSDPLTIALCLADINVGPMEGAAFGKETGKLFVEDNTDIDEKLRSGATRKEIEREAVALYYDDEVVGHMSLLASYALRILAWFESEADYPLRRRKRLTIEELALMPEKVRKALEPLFGYDFSHTGDAVEAGKLNVVKLKAMKSPWEKLEYVGFQLPAA